MKLIKQGILSHLISDLYCPLKLLVCRWYGMSWREKYNDSSWVMGEVRIRLLTAKHLSQWFIFVRWIAANSISGMQITFSVTPFLNNPQFLQTLWCKALENIIGWGANMLVTQHFQPVPQDLVLSQKKKMPSSHLLCFWLIWWLQNAFKK